MKKHSLTSSSSHEAEEDVAQFKQTAKSSVAELSFPLDKAASLTYSVLVTKGDESDSKIAVIGTDLPRLMHRMTVRGEYIENRELPDIQKYEWILQKLYASVYPLDNSSTTSTISQHISSVFTSDQATTKYSKHQNLTSVILEIFTMEHPVITLLRSSNQNSIGPSLVFLKKLFYERLDKMEFKDQRWRISINSSIDVQQQAVQVVHHRKERVMASKGIDLVVWFIFSYDIEFNYQRQITLDEFTPLKLSTYNIKYIGIEDFDTTVEPSKSSLFSNNAQAADKILRELFESNIHSIDYNNKIL
jgi:hypothetical protein